MVPNITQMNAGVNFSVPTGWMPFSSDLDNCMNLTITIIHQATNNSRISNTNFSINIRQFK